MNKLATNGKVKPEAAVRLSDNSMRSSELRALGQELTRINNIPVGPTTPMGVLHQELTGGSTRDAISHMIRPAVDLYGGAVRDIWGVLNGDRGAVAGMPKDRDPSSADSALSPIMRKLLNRVDPNLQSERYLQALHAFGQDHPRTLSAQQHFLATMDSDRTVEDVWRDSNDAQIRSYEDNAPIYRQNPLQTIRDAFTRDQTPEERLISQDQERRG